MAKLSEGSLEAARDLLARTFAWDNHACMPLRPHDVSFLPQIARAREAGWNAVTINIGFGDQGPEEHLAVLEALRAWFAARPDCRLVQTLDDLDQAHAEGRLAILFDIEGARAVGDRLDLVPRYRAGGVRWMLIAYNRENLAGYGCLDDEDLGLKPFGRELVRALEREGLTVCCSHTGHRTARDVMAMAEGPVIFSHSNCAALHPHPRNIPDALIRDCAATGGVVGICGIGDFLGPAGADLPQAIVEHVDHAVQLVGPQHVGLALDHVYDRQEMIDFILANRSQFPADYDETAPMAAPEDLTAITAGLLSRGYGEADLARILGGNWRRVAQATW